MANNTQEEVKTKFNSKKIILLILVFILIAAGFIIFYSPVLRPGLSVLAPELEREVNFLVLGIDDRELEEIKTDGIMLASIDATREKIAFQSIVSTAEKDLEELRYLPREEIIKAIEDYTDSEIEYYLTISYEGFINFINEINGIEISLDNSLTVPDLGLFLTEGKNLLSGKEALNYTRWYDLSAGEKDRLQRQHQVVNAIIQKAFQTNTLSNIKNLYKSFLLSYQTIETNIEMELIMELIKFLRNNSNVKIEYEII